MLRPRAEALPSSAVRPTAIVALLLLAAVTWHLCLPAFFYRGPGVFIDGPLPAIVGVGIALWFWRNEPPLLQAVVACAGALLAILASVLILGTWTAGPLRAIAALWGELREGFRLPFSAAVDTWGSPYFSYSLWSGLRPLLLWGTIVFVVVMLREPEGRKPLRGLLGGVGDRWAFKGEQRRQMKAYQAIYLAAVRGGEAPPPPPTGLMPPSGVSGLTTAHLVLKIGLAVACALGITGGAWSLLGDALKGPLATIFWRGLVGG